MLQLAAGVSEHIRRARSGELACRRFGVVLEDLGSEVLVVVDLEAGSVEPGTVLGEDEVTILTRSETLRHTRQGELQPGSAIVHGLVRMTATSEESEQTSGAVLALFLDCVRATESPPP